MTSRKGKKPGKTPTSRKPKGPPVKHPTLYEEHEVEAHLRANNGRLYLTAAKMGVSYATLRSYVLRWPKLREVIQEARNKITDQIEDKLVQSALRSEGWAVCFYLKTQAKSRGYVERVQHRDSPDPKAPPKVAAGYTLDQLDLSVEVLRALHEAVQKKKEQEKPPPPAQTFPDAEAYPPPAYPGGVPASLTGGSEQDRVNV